MVIETRRDNGTLVIRAEDRLDLANAQVFHDELDAAIESSERAVVIDMSGLTYISSAGLRVIIQMLREVATAGCPVGAVFAIHRGAERI